MRICSVRRSCFSCWAWGPPARSEPLALFCNHSVILLLGSMAIGAASFGTGRAQMEQFLLTPLYGVLCLFLLDMGLQAGRQMGALRSNGRGLMLFGCTMPLLDGATALLASALT